MSTSPDEGRPDYAVVIPTTGRESLQVLLGALARGTGPRPRQVLVVDDRPDTTTPLLLAASLPLRVLRSGGAGPAAARNLGWRATDCEWVAFLDDDVVPADDWPARLAGDLTGTAPDVAASQARIGVPMPVDRRPTDAERGTASLQTSSWITADMAYRRDALEKVGGFDERFPRAYREDAELALRVSAAGYRLTMGGRWSTHPVRPAGFFASVGAQRGNADDALMRRLYGSGWRHRIGGHPGRLRQHAVTTAAGIATVLFGLMRKKRGALIAGLVWTGLTVEFALRRILPGPRTAEESLRMIVTSVAIPPAACAHRLRGELRFRGVPPAEAPSWL